MAAILATQWVLEVAGVWYAAARTRGYLWHLSPGLISSLVGLRLAHLAEGSGPEALAYLSALVELHQALDWAAAGPYLARRFGGDEEVPRAFVHCDKRLVAGRLGLREGLGVATYPSAQGVTPTTPPPQSGWEAASAAAPLPLGWGTPGVVAPPQRKRTRGPTERPPSRGGAVRRSSRPAPSPGQPTFAPPGVPFTRCRKRGTG